ncbi:hypothetical protein GMA19_02294 [Paenibacillus polymyxa E681]|uniref:hypothetical protein n=1 Tax=Paenibacillus polymyxa TaxID=1406 RepID=UPI0001E31A05|nr:hypothetical protein [Paenibacillus polymyxa]ADM70100.1 hypothetical protein PPE_02267 [Paenibacillus polymyxa E681]QNV57127.1 hypothetical protein GE561_02294 [Paenibacillus polymyxa E681]QNV61964.1 hypothetical protein GMA19_02294 [Paenibacillus polymyxa E681]
MSIRSKIKQSKTSFTRNNHAKKKKNTPLINPVLKFQTKDPRQKKGLISRKYRVNQVVNYGFDMPNFFPWRAEGAVYLSTLRPYTGPQSAFFAVQPGRSAYLRQRVTLGQPGSNGYRLTYYVLVDRNNNNGVLQISLLNTAVSRTIPLNTLPYTSYQPFSIFFSDADVNGQSNVDLEIRVNGGSSPSFLLLDVVTILPRN